MTTVNMRFPGKSAPTKDKLRGGYYTPSPIAEFLARWTSEAGPITLEPSAGDGAILEPLAQYSQPTAIELLNEEASKAEERTGVPVNRGDFFSWFNESKYGSFDGVAGNPPYIRFGNWDESLRAPALAFMESQGLKPTRLTNAWLPFVVASVVATRSGGRIGLVIPAELLQVDYARQVRSFLVDNCKEITLVSFSKLVFPGVLQEVVLVLAVKGRGPAMIRGVEVENELDLNSIDLNTAAVHAPLHDSEKWTKYYLEPTQVETLRFLLNDDRLVSFGTLASVNVGVVTGRNSFFCMTESEAKNRGLFEYTTALLARSASIGSVLITSDDLKEAETRGFNNRLLTLSPDFDVTPYPLLTSYIASGEKEGVHLGYKCSIRTPWWYVPSAQVPDGFMLRQVSNVLRVASNHAACTSTDTVHRVFTRPGVNMDKLAVASLNSATFAFAEILGRSYGGGLLEIEPREALKLPVPSPDLVPDSLVPEVDSLLRDNRLNEAVSLVDRQVLVRGAGISLPELESLQQAQRRLLERRTGRGKKK